MRLLVTNTKNYLYKLSYKYYITVKYINNSSCINLVRLIIHIFIFFFFDVCIHLIPLLFIYELRLMSINITNYI